MFTGLIEKVGSLDALLRRENGWTLRVSLDPWEDTLVRGESIAVQGACLTVTDFNRQTFTCDVLDETLSRTNLERKGQGAVLNLERALRPADRLGGHVVTGHIDGLGTVESCQQHDRDRILCVRCSADLMEGIVSKGSVALDGISLTVADVATDTFTVHIIPTTWEGTSLAERKSGDTMNIETDLLGKYVRRYVSDASATSSVTMESLHQAGYL